MGNVRTPKPVYFKGGLVEFFVKNKIRWYRTIIYTKDGMTQFEFERGIYSENLTPIKDIVNRALHNFSSVGVIEN